MGSRKKNILMALTVAMFLAAVEGTVVTTAIPTISRDLQGFQIISLVFSVYLLASAISTPIYGKLSDLYGRKNNAFHRNNNVFKLEVVCADYHRTCTCL